MWVVFALSAALTAAIVVIISKAGMKNMDSSLAFAIQAVLILLVSWSVVFYQGKHAEMGTIDTRTWVLLGVAGLLTTLSSLLSFRALKIWGCRRGIAGRKTFPCICNRVGCCFPERKNYLAGDSRGGTDGGRCHYYCRCKKRLILLILPGFRAQNLCGLVNSHFVFKTFDGLQPQVRKPGRGFFNPGPYICGDQ